MILLWYVIPANYYYIAAPHECCYLFHVVDGVERPDHNT